LDLPSDCVAFCDLTALSGCESALPARSAETRMDWASSLEAIPRVAGDVSAMAVST